MLSSVITIPNIFYKSTLVVLPLIYLYFDINLTAAQTSSLPLLERPVQASQTDFYLSQEVSCCMISGLV